MLGSGRGVSCEDTCAICLGAGEGIVRANGTADHARSAVRACGGRHYGGSACPRGYSCEVTDAARGPRRTATEDARAGAAAYKYESPARRVARDGRRRLPPRVLRKVFRSLITRRVLITSRCASSAGVVAQAGAGFGAAGGAGAGRRGSRCSPSPSAHAFGVLPVVGATGQFWTCPGRSWPVRASRRRRVR